MDSYILLAEAVTEFESDYNSIPAAEQNKHGLAIQQDELKALWEKPSQLTISLSMRDYLRMMLRP